MGDGVKSEGTLVDALADPQVSKVESGEGGENAVDGAQVPENAPPLKQEVCVFDRRWGPISTLHLTGKLPFLKACTRCKRARVSTRPVA